MNFREFLRYHRSFLVFLGLVVLGALAVDGFALYKRRAYAREITRLRAGMSDIERRRTDLALDADDRRVRVMLELIRRQARLDKEIHLAVSLDTGRIYLEREGAVLRAIDAAVGPTRTVGVAPDTVVLAQPRGERSVQRVLAAGEPWEVPRWVYHDRGLPVPEDRTLKGALGDGAIVLNGGTLIYAAPTVGPLNDPSYVMPGSIRISAEDMAAIKPNIAPGTAVYFW